MDGLTREARNAGMKLASADTPRINIADAV